MPTRISGACNGCRQKKQKCSGDKSGCAQCEAAGIPCTWPEQRKRGPAKGYIEGLEHRLHEAESLLLHILPHVSADQLQTATSLLANHENTESGRDSPDRRGSPPILNKKTGIEYWDKFPLTSVASVRRWQQDCEIHGATQGSTSGSSIKAEAHGSSPASHHILSASSSDLNRQKRASLPAHSSASPFDRNSTNASPSLDEFFGVQDNRRSSIQHIMPIQQQQQQPQRSHMQMAMNQQRDPWQQQHSMMNIGGSGSAGAASTTNDLPQHQMFANVGYLNTSSAWSQQADMNMDLSGSQDATMHESIPVINTQTHSHLFW